ncbi:2,4-dienoyl-CoA reductase-like NADH-dependent reductase (Old Yellow Enzyme family) [Microbacteriaceae bacterium SG_E_30_P1]|uniref:2,4-dienoyl-CoA reductase-like NADH-dependent reductase (Old Yellow Enzyme family) n=1 Tax=Antiquaquibacter oligotrophicus TaxID=2880260 RepID=A0ABT6KKI1_9MICO|nr:NADH:flavin oxidoreductase/NADH oxidase [Antiquaquibacter oligotrophicus]MDH6180501.1 2,4-dienoyl-CoA reductase-like NADH-dependent reductase (Old Yellow Enzyme family) [Antiquaquibacter oligotrophicus]UDF13763.1 NADH:flavin oxidoreductase/NADH oxidase [Antiquaquibacter oligotrophicus]
MTSLFTPLTIRDTQFRNRLWVAPLCQYSVDQQDGVPVDWHLVHLGSFALGGAGLVMTEATAVNPEGRISPQDTGIWNDEQAQAWERIVRFIRSQGAVAGIQLAHAGRKGSTWLEWDERHGTVPASEGGWEPVAPSAVPFPGYATPRSLDTDEIDDIVTDFVAAARRSLDAGFQLLEIHAAHGYLLHEFLSPLSNLREDEYGGPLENRARLLLRIVRAVRAEVGEGVPIFVRFSATDWADDGWEVEQTGTVAGWAKDAGADLFDISSGGLLSGVHIPTGPGYQVPFAERVKDAADADVSAVGLITTPQQANEIVSSGRADAVMMGRQLMREPHFAWRAAHELGATVEYPPQYERARWR